MRIKRKNPVRNCSLPDEKVDLSLLDGLLKKYAGMKGSMISILQGTQEIYGYIPKSAIRKISEEAVITSYSIHYTKLYEIR